MSELGRAIADHHDKKPRSLDEKMSYGFLRDTLEKEDRKKKEREAKKSPAQRERQRRIEGGLVGVLVLLAAGWWLADRFALGGRSGAWLESYFSTQTWVGSYYGAIATPLMFAFDVNEIVEDAARAMPAVSGAAERARSNSRLPLFCDGVRGALLHCVAIRADAPRRDCRGACAAVRRGAVARVDDVMRRR